MPSLKTLMSTGSKLSAFVVEFSTDLLLYVKHCGVSPMQDATKRRYYKLLIEAHALEKGLSLENPRPLFGKAKIAFLMRELDRYDFAYSPFPAQMVLGVLQAYADRHRGMGLEEPLLTEIDAYLLRKQTEMPCDHSGGLRHFPSAYATSLQSPQSFLKSRFSNRIVSDAPLDPERVKAAVTLAQSTPSQCNRQAAQAHFYQDKEKVSELLSLQGGASGFKESLGNLFVISCDLAAWGGAQQRNQVYVDGALFAMTLIYALHAEGIAACPLNLAVRNKTEKKVKSVADIPQDQRLIMMIAVGDPIEKDGFKAAASPRRPVNEVLCMHG